jgi:dihydroxy-acid dehydratase
VDGWGAATCCSTTRSCRLKGPAEAPASRTPWQQIYRATVGPLSTGACLELAVPYRGVADTPPRRNH